jgi:hypothetical protein
MYNMLTDHCIEDRSIARYVKYNDRFLKEAKTPASIQRCLLQQKLEG